MIPSTADSADEGEQPGLGVGVVLHRHPRTALPGRSHDAATDEDDGMLIGADFFVGLVMYIAGGDQDPEHSVADAGDEPGDLTHPYLPGW